MYKRVSRTGGDTEVVGTGERRGLCRSADPSLGRSLRVHRLRPSAFLLFCFLPFPCPVAAGPSPGPPSVGLCLCLTAPGGSLGAFGAGGPWTCTWDAVKMRLLRDGFYPSFPAFPRAPGALPSPLTVGPLSICPSGVRGPLWTQTVPATLFSALRGPGHLHHRVVEGTSGFPGSTLTVRFPCVLQYLMRRICF